MTSSARSVALGADGAPGCGWGSDGGRRRRLAGVAAHADGIGAAGGARSGADRGLAGSGWRRPGIVAVVVLTAAALAAAWLTRAQRSTHTQRRPSAMAAADLLAPVRDRSRPNGVRLALDRRAPALPIRSAIGGVTVAILGAVAVLTVSASLDRLLATPDRWGFEWDLMLNFTSDEVDAAAARLVDDERLSRGCQVGRGLLLRRRHRVQRRMA